MKLDKLLSWTDKPPKNKFLKLIYWPAFIIVGLFLFGMITIVLPELAAWAFGFSCLIWIVVWPIMKIYEWITGKKVL
jgi:hypothetical protein